jgi:titin
LNWQPPIRDGGSPITGYVIERRTAANYKWHVSIPSDDSFPRPLLLGVSFQGATEPVAETKTKVHGLHTGHKYEFRVRAQNLAGLGEPSNSTKETEIREPIIGDKPRFIQELEPVTVVTGRTVTLSARVKGDPAPTFKW